MFVSSKCLMFNACTVSTQYLRRFCGKTVSLVSKLMPLKLLGLPSSRAKHNGQWSQTMHCSRFQAQFPHDRPIHPPRQLPNKPTPV